MNERAAQADPEGATAGALLRAARQKQGLHIGALAASIKVPPQKLEALEAGRYDELPDATFTRALAQSICRVLKIEAQPVLALLPSTAAARLEKVDGGLNTPFRERPGSIVPADWALLRQPVMWLVLLLLAVAALFTLAPGDWLQRWLPASREGEVATAPATSGGTAPSASAAPGRLIESITTPVTGASATGAAGPGMAPGGAASAPASAVVAAAGLPTGAAVATPAAVPPATSPGLAPAPAAAASGAVAAAARVRAVQATWIQLSDARGQVLISRTLQQGEVLDLDGARPLRLRIGNVRGTELHQRGQRIDLEAMTQNNVASIELR